MTVSPRPTMCKALPSKDLALVVVVVHRHHPGKPEILDSGSIEGVVPTTTQNECQSSSKLPIQTRIITIWLGSMRNLGVDPPELQP